MPMEWIVAERPCQYFTCEKCPTRAQNPFHVLFHIAGQPCSTCPHYLQFLITNLDNQPRDEVAFQINTEHSDTSNMSSSGPSWGFRH